MTINELRLMKIYLGSRSGYLTIVMDLDSGAMVEVAEGKHAQALTPFWKRLRCSRAKVEYGTSLYQGGQGKPPGCCFGSRPFSLIVASR